MNFPYAVWGGVQNLSLWGEKAISGFAEQHPKSFAPGENQCTVRHHPGMD